MGKHKKSDVQRTELRKFAKSGFKRKRLSHEILEARRLLALTTGLAEPQSTNASSLTFLAQATPVDPFVVDGVSLESIQTRAASLPYKSNEVVVAIKSPAKSATHDVISAAWDAAVPTQPTSSRHMFTLDQPDGTAIALYSVTTTLDVMDVTNQLFNASNVLWASPSFVYDGPDPRDAIPSDPRYGEQYHHPLMENDIAWDTTFGDSSIVIAVTDDGVDITHPDLAANIWDNPGEIAGNGIDDDNNGYVDDVNGWDFIDDDNNPDPNGGSHGTHVSGIAAAVTDNSIGVSGVAGGATIMPLRFFDGTDVSTFTSSLIAETYTYAADNGAHIINTSYSIDYFVGDPVYTAGVQYAYDQGVLHINSAGNAGIEDPWRLDFEQKLFVSNTDANDVLSSSTNFGEGVDLSAPGESILSTFPGGQYGTLSGTSMSAPNVAGVAALIWSQNPTWTRDQVAAQLLETADDLSAQNPLKANLLGTGRVNSNRALSETIDVPSLSITGLPEDGGRITTETTDAFEIRFDQLMDTATINDSSTFELREAGVDRQFDTADDVIIGLNHDRYFVGTNVLEFSLPGILEFGDYRLTVDATLAANPFGQQLDGNGDGTGGDDHVRHFQVAPPAFSGETPLGGLIHSTNFVTSIRNMGEVDRYSYEFDAGQSASALVESVSGLAPRIQVIDPNGAVVMDVTSTDTSTVSFESLPILISGNYDFLVESSTTAAGDYEATFFLNASFDSETLSGGVTNNTLATSQPLAAYEISLGATSAQMGISGELSATDTEDWYAFDLSDGQRATIVTNAENPSDELNLELYDSSGNLIASGISTLNASGAISGFEDQSTDGLDNTYHIRVSGLANYRLVTLLDAEFDLESVAVAQELTGSNILGFVTKSFSGSADADDVGLGTNISSAFPNVVLSDVYGGDVIARESVHSSTGTRVFSPDATDVEWKSGEHELRADFDIPVDFVSIDVSANDGSDVAVLHAFDHNENLLATIFSQVVSAGSPEALEINRASGDIGYIIVTGLGNDSVVLDNLAFGLSNGTDTYTIDVQPNDLIDIQATPPVQGPYEFEGKLFESGNESIGMRLFDPTGLLVSSGSTSLNHNAIQAGQYEVQVFSNDRPGEYFLEFGGLNPTNQPPSVLQATPTDSGTLGSFPETITLTFSEAIDLTTVDASDLQINAMPALSVISAGGNQITFELDPAANNGLVQQDLTFAANAVNDLQGLGNSDFSQIFRIRSIEDFQPLGPEGGLAFISTTDASFSNPNNLERFSFFAHAGETVAARITPAANARLTAELLGLGGQVAASTNGETIFIDEITVATDQTITLLVGTDQITDIQVDLIRNANIGDLKGESPTTLSPMLETVTNTRFSATGTLAGVSGEIDTYLLDLSDYVGASVDFAIQGESSPFNGMFEITDPSGNVVAASSSGPAGSFEQVVFDFSPTEAGVYSVVVQGEWDGEYGLVASAEYYLGDVNDSHSTRSLNAASGAIGFLEQGESDTYDIQMVAGATLSLSIQTPLNSVMGANGNALQPTVSVRDSSGNLALLVETDGVRVLTADQSDSYTIVVDAVVGSGEYTLTAATSGGVFVDFNLDGIADCHDANGLVSTISSGIYDPAFDLTDDGSVDQEDLEVWLQDAALFNGLELPYLPGDANLDGVVDVSDFNAWNSNRFTFTSGWCTGDFTADGVVDVIDFNVWNTNKFTSGLALNLNVDDVVVDEGDTAVFNLTLTRALTIPGRVNLIARTLTATGSVDFDNYGFEYSEDGGATWIPTHGNSGSEVRFNPGITSLLVRIDTVEDTLLEPSEQFELNGFSVSFALTNFFPGIATIIDDDDVSTLAISDATANEGSPLVFTLTPDIVLANDSTLKLATVDIDATGGVDFEINGFEYSRDGGTTWLPAFGTNADEIDFLTTDTQILVRVDTVDDSLVEFDELFTLDATVITGSIGAVISGTGTIVDNDVADVTIGDGLIVEGGLLEFDISLSQTSVTDIQIDLATVSGTATVGSDVDNSNFEFSVDDGVTWQPASGVNGSLVTIRTGTTNVLGRIGTIDDGQLETDEDFAITATIVSGPGGAVTDGTGTILDNDSGIELEFGDQTVLEGLTMSFSANLSALSTQDIVADVFFTNISTTAGEDFNATNIEYSVDFGNTWIPADGPTGTQVTIPAGIGGVLVRTETINDILDEPIETFSISADILSGSITSVASGTGTIGDDDVIITIGDGTVTEGDQLILPISINHSTTKQIRLSLDPISISATEGIDFEDANFEYSPNGGTTWFDSFGPDLDRVSILPGRVSILVRIDTFDDAIVEGVETFTLSAISDTNNHGPIIDGTVTINDDEAAPELTVSETTALESGLLEYSLTLDNASATDTIVDLVTTDGTALAGVDFDATSFEFSDDDGTTWLPATGINGTEVTLLAGSTSLLVRHATIDDSSEEPIETFELGATVISGTIGAVTSGTATIGDDDVSITIGDADTIEGTPLVFPITLGTPTTAQIRVDITPLDGTATGGTDFETSSFEYSFDNGTTWLDAFGSSLTTVSINAGLSEILVRLNTIDDNDAEGDETLTLSADSVTSNHGAITDGLGTIIDDDAAVNLTISNASVTEGSPFVFTLSQSIVDIVDSIIDLSVVSGTATSGTDVENGSFEFSTDSGTTWQPAGGANETEVTIAAGMTDLMVRIDTLDDSIFEGDEDFTLTASILAGSINSILDGAGTIVDDESIPTLSISDGDAMEGLGIVFEATLSTASSLDTLLDISTIDGTAVGASDFETDNFEFSNDAGATWNPATGANATQVTMLAGSSSILIRIDSLQDSTHEGDESFTVSATILNGTVGTITDGTGTILDDDSIPDITISDGSETEGSPLVFAVSLTNPSSATTTLDFNTSDLLAVGGSDFETDNFEYSADGGTTWLAAGGANGTEVSIPAGMTTVDLRIDTLQDAIAEGNEDFTVSASALAGTIGTITSGTGTIVDDEPLPTLQIGDASTTEAGDLVFTITGSSAASTDIVIDLTPGSGTATSGDDYESTNFEFSDDGGATWNPATGANGTQVTMTAGLTSLLARINTFDDSLYEGDETFNLTATIVSGPVGGVLGGTATILDDESIPDLVIGDASATEGDGLEFTITLSGASATATTFDLTTTGVSATGDVDFETTSFEFSDDGGATWQAAGGPNGTEFTLGSPATSILARIDSLQDTVAEGTETFGLSAVVTSGTIATISDGTGTILDDEPVPNLTISDDTKLEGQLLSYTITLSDVAGTDVMLELNPIDGSAVAGDDFATSFEFSDDFGATWQAAGGANGSEVTIAAGNTSLLVRHAAVDDSAEEPIETFELSANVISGAVGTVTPGTAMIGDDDVVVTLNDASVDEGGQLVFTMDLTYATTKQIRLNVVPGDDTATGPDDFETSGFEYSFNNGAVWFNAFGPNADLVAFNPGQTSILVRIDTVDDAIFEGDETFTLSAESDTNNNGPIVDAVATIIDNDPPPAPTTPGNGFLDAVYSDYGREDDDEGSERDSHLPDWLW